MAPRSKKLIFILFILLSISIATGLILYALKENVNAFYSPSDVVISDKTIRVGGLVVENSVKYVPNSSTVLFEITDQKKNLLIKYTGILPDLFREGQGIIAQGKFIDQQFVAAQVLAKHDEKYMPPEVQAILDKNLEQNNAS